MKTLLAVGYVFSLYVHVKIAIRFSAYSLSEMYNCI